MFTDIVHHIAQFGEHALEFAEGQQSITINGATFTRDDVVNTVKALTEFCAKVGISL